MTLRLLDKIAMRFKRFELVPVYNAGTAVPTQNRVIVSGRTHSLGLFKTVHCLPEKFVGTDTGFVQNGFCPPFISDAGIIRSFVIARNSRKIFGNTCVTDGIIPAEAVAHCEDDIYQGFLIVRFDLKYIEAYALGRAGFVKQTVMLRFFECGRDGLFR